MARITQKGRELVSKLSEGSTREMLEAASLLCRAATTYRRIQEAWCDGMPARDYGWFYKLPVERQNEMQAKFDAYLEKRTPQITRRIEILAAQLPGVKRVSFQGDPRGCTVKLVMYDGRSDDWGREGLCVPGA